MQHRAAVSATNELLYLHGFQLTTCLDAETLT